jgi:hypothetical protein
MISTRNIFAVHIGRRLLARRESAARLLALPCTVRRRAVRPLAIRRISTAADPENEAPRQGRLRSHSTARELLCLTKSGILARADRALSAQGNGLPRDIP